MDKHTATGLASSDPRAMSVVCAHATAMDEWNSRFIDCWSLAVRTVLVLTFMLFGVELLLAGDLWVAVVALLIAVAQLLVAMSLRYGELLMRVAFVLIGVGGLLLGVNFLKSDFMLIGILCLVAGYW